jgi:hypothetical protein
MTQSMVINRIQPWVPRYALEELGGDLQSLNCECFGFIQRLRDHAWANFGIPANEEKVMELGLAFRFSRYKFRKYWNELKKFFTEIDGRLFFTRDLEHRDAAVEKSSKLQESGRLGAEIRKNRNGYSRSSVPKMGHGQAILFDGNLHPDPDIQTPIPPPAEECRPVVEAREAAGGGGEVEKIIANGNGMKNLEAEHRAISEHCHRIGIPAPSPVLSSQLRAKFPGIPISEVLQNLPRFDGQTSPGLWRDLGPESLKAEAQRQKNPVQPKKKMTSADVLRAEIAQRAGGGG